MKIHSVLFRTIPGLMGIGDLFEVREADQGLDIVVFAGPRTKVQDGGIRIDFHIEIQGQR